MLHITGSSSDYYLEQQLGIKIRVIKHRKAPNKQSRNNITRKFFLNKNVK